MRYLRRLRFWLLAQTGHKHDWGITWVEFPRDDGTTTSGWSAGSDCDCGRCPTGHCDGTGQPEREGWADAWTI